MGISSLFINERVDGCNAMLGEHSVLHFKVGTKSLAVTRVPSSCRQRTSCSNAHRHRTACSSIHRTGTV